MNYDHRDALSITLAMTLAVLSRLSLSDWVQIIVAICAVGNLGISFLRWRFPR